MYCIPYVTAFVSDARILVVVNTITVTAVNMYKLLFIYTFPIANGLNADYIMATLNLRFLAFLYFLQTTF